MARPRLPSHVAAGALALALLSALWPSGAAAHTCDDPFSTDLIAGQKIDAGDVKVCNDHTTLTITYEATYSWCLLETNLHVATIPDPPADPDGNIPQNRPGNPIPGHDYGDEYGGCLDGPAIFEIPLDEIGGGVGPGDSVAIAAHAEVEDDTGREEGAWGKGQRFVARVNWAMYFTYVVQAPLLCGGEASKCVFVTSTIHNSELDGLTGADAICQDLAEAGGSLAAPGTYLAWLSAGGVVPPNTSPSTRFTQATMPYRRVDGTTVASNWTDLTDGFLMAPINVDEGGSIVPDNDFTVQVWTATLFDGSRHFNGDDCGGWTGAGTAEVGRAFEVTRFWTEGLSLSCLFSHIRLYCFQQ